jgi:hypothetical protein
VPLTATPPRPHPRRRPRPSFTLTPSSASPSPSSSQAHGARGRAAPDLAGCPDPGPRARVAAASRPRAVHTPCAPARRGLSRPHAGSALRACDPCYGKAAWATRWHWVGERWRLAVTTGCAGVLDATPHARGRVPARHAPSAVGDAHDAPCCAVWQARAAAAPWRAPPGGLGAPPRRAVDPVCRVRAAVRRRLGSSRSSWCSSSAPPRSPTPRAHRRHVFLPALAHTA